MDKADFGCYRRWKAWRPETFGSVSAADALAFRAEAARAGLPVDTPGVAVLEIGFGNGAFAGWATRRGWSFVGTERDPALVARARQFGLEAHLANVGLQRIAGDRRFDAVMAFDLLEHLTVPEILALLEEAKHVMAPHGLLIARFPSGDSPFSGPQQHGDLTHRTSIGSEMARQLALIAGYRVIDVRGAALPVLGLGVLRAGRRLLVLGARACVSWLLRFAFHDGRERVVAPAMVLVLQPDARGVGETPEG